MTAHEDLIRALLVERYRPWPPIEQPDNGAQQLATALAHEKRRARATPKRSRKPRHLTDHEQRGAT